MVTASVPGSVRLTLNWSSAISPAVVSIRECYRTQRTVKLAHRLYEQGS